MSKTYKKAFYTYYRRPRGYKRAVIGGARSKAIPPTSWDELSICNLTNRPWKAVKNMLADGIPQQVAIHKIMKKFNYSHFESKRIVDYIYRNL